MDDRRRSFDMLVLPHLDAAYRFARCLSRSPSDADDVVQEAILRAFRGFESLRGSDVKAWLLAIVRDRHLTSLKLHPRHAAVLSPSERDVQSGEALVAITPGPESTTIHRDDERILDRLILALPQAHREIMVLREVEEMNYREIAAVINVPIGTVMSRLARARAALKFQWMQETKRELHAVR